MTHPRTTNPGVQFGTDTIEVVNEVDQVVFLFTATPETTAEQLVETWAMTGAQTWTSQRGASCKDLINFGLEELRDLVDCRTDRYAGSTCFTRKGPPHPG